MVDYSLEAGEKTRIGPNCTCRFWEIKVPPDSRPVPTPGSFPFKYEYLPAFLQESRPGCLDFPTGITTFSAQTSWSSSASGGGCGLIKHNKPASVGHGNFNIVLHSCIANRT